MNSEQLKNKIENIDPNISVSINPDTNEPIAVYLINYDDLGSKIVPLSNDLIYTFFENEWNFKNVYENLDPNQVDKLQSLVNEYRNQFRGNPFKEFTDQLAETLQEKNDAYGDSFTKSVDEDGLLVLKIRLGDKLNRVSSLIKKGELKENDESLEDTLLDLAGYSILGLKYLEEHKDESN